MAFVCLAEEHNEDGDLENMGKLVTIVVCPNCGNEMIKIEDSRFGGFFECCICKKKFYVPEKDAHTGPILVAK